MCCEKCSKGLGIVLLVLGIVYMLVDLGVWSFWGLNWWTVVFILAGISMIGYGCCAECKTPKKKK